MDIVKSDQWLNLIPENGLSGAPPGIEFSAEHKTKISMSMSGRKHSIEHIEKVANANRGKKRSVESCARNSAAQKGLKRGPPSAETLQKSLQAEEKA